MWMLCEVHMEECALIQFGVTNIHRIRGNNKCTSNLMLFAHVTHETWEQCYYTSIDSLSSQDKALHRWISHVNCDVNSILVAQRVNAHTVEEIVEDNDYR